VEAQGPGVCHEGYQSCFFRKLTDGEWQVVDHQTYDPKAVYESRPDSRSGEPGRGPQQ